MWLILIQQVLIAIFGLFALWNLRQNNKRGYFLNGIGAVIVYLLPLIVHVLDHL